MGGARPDTKGYPDHRSQEHSSNKTNNTKGDYVARLTPSICGLKQKTKLEDLQSLSPLGSLPVHHLAEHSTGF